jgi:hypothetical protein
MTVEPSADVYPELLLDEVLASFGHLLAAIGVPPHQAGARLGALMASESVGQAGVPIVDLGRLQRDCMEVMCLWRRDPEFLDDDGLPKRLAPQAGPATFESLCRAAGTDSDPAQVLSVLIRFGAVCVDERGRLAPKTPTFLLAQREGQSLVARDGVLKQLSGFLRVLEHNVRLQQRGSRPRFERSCSVRLAAEMVPIFEVFVSDRGQQFIDSIDEWLERQKSVASSSGRTIEVGAGAYFLEAEPS